jgi:hypothetical protein
MKLPKPRPKQIKFGSEIDAQLLEQVKLACKERKLKLKDAIEYGLTKFLKAKQ